MGVNGHDTLNLHGLDSADGDKMNKAITTQRNHKASLRYINSLNTEMHSTGENYFENWRTQCCWYAQLQIPPPHE